MGHCDIEKTIISSHSLSIRKNKIEPFAQVQGAKDTPREVSDSPNSGLHRKISFSSRPVWPDESDFFHAELIHPFILGSNIQKIKTRICCYWQVVTELDCIKTRTDTGYFLVLCNGPCFIHTISRRNTLHNSLVAFPMPQLLFLFTFSSVSKDLQGAFLTMKRVLCGDLDSSMVSTGKNP